MDAPLLQGEEENMYDVLLSEDTTSPDKELLMDSLRKEIERALNTLTRREADIIRLFFGVNGKHLIKAPISLKNKTLHNPSSISSPF